MRTDASTLEVTVSHVVRVAGELDASNSGAVEQTVRSLPDGARHIDATGVTFAGSAALGVLLKLVNEARGGCTELTIAPSPELRRLARIARLEAALPLC